MTNLIVRKPRNTSDIINCVNMYLSLDEPGFMPASFDSSCRSLVNHWQHGGFIRLVEEDGRLIAWIFAICAPMDHISEKIVSQRYYASKTSGVKSFRALKLLHDEMLAYAHRINAAYCTSTGSHFDTAFTFTRMLEKCGWTRRGYLAIYKMKDYHGTLTKINRGKT